MGKQLLQVPALALPDLVKPFDLYIHERRGIALGVLDQKLGPLIWVVAYFSKQWDKTAKGWAPCLRAVAATSILLTEAEKLMFGQPITIWTLHQVQALVSSKGTEQLSPGSSIQLQAMLLDNCHYHKNLSHPKSCHPATHRNGAPGVWLYRTWYIPVVLT